MLIEGVHRQSIWYEVEDDRVLIIDQTQLPHRFEILELDSLADACDAISLMQVRGAPLIGVTAAYGVYLALRENPDALENALEQLAATRPTAVNLRWALERCRENLLPIKTGSRAAEALQLAQVMEKEDIAVCEAIGEHGAKVLADIWRSRSKDQSCLNVLTHCNAGSLATVDWGTALAVIYKAAGAGIPIHVWVDETRPRNQGAALSCWELAQNGVDNTLIVDNAGGLLMQQGKVDLCLVGSDRTALNGDFCNKIGTYLKAVAAADQGIPFYVAFPVSTIDFRASDGLGELLIEERDTQEVTHLFGTTDTGERQRIGIAPAGVKVSNYGFDITPARLVTAHITEKGVVEPSLEGLSALAD